MHDMRSMWRFNFELFYNFRLLINILSLNLSQHLQFV